MGYGGALIWTGLAKNLKKAFPEKEVIFVYRKNIQDSLLCKKNPDFVIYEQNPHIKRVVSKLMWFFLQLFEDKKRVLVVDLGEKKYHYWSNDSKEKLTYRTEGHAIAIACKPFALSSISLETVLQTTPEEEKKIAHLLQVHGLTKTHFICVEPNAKKTFTANKQWPLTHWKKLIEMLNQQQKERSFPYPIVQIGAPGSTVLPGVINMTGATTFRELRPLIKQSALVICNEGGVAHLTASTQTKAVVIANPSLPLNLMAYPQHTTIAPLEGAHNCGLRAPCLVCQERLASITPEAVFQEVQKLLEN